MQTAYTQTNYLNYPKDGDIDIIAILGGDYAPLKLKGAISLYQEIQSEGGYPVIVYINHERRGMELRRLIERYSGKGYRIVTLPIENFEGREEEVKVNSLTVVTDENYELDPLIELRTLEDLNAKVQSFGWREDKYGNSIRQLGFARPVSFRGLDRVLIVVRSMYYPVKKAGWLKRFKRSLLTRFHDFIDRLYIK